MTATSKNIRKRQEVSKNDEQNTKKSEPIHARTNYQINNILEPVKLITNLEVVERLSNCALNIRKIAKFKHETHPGKAQQLLKRYDELIDEILARLDISETKRKETNERISETQKLATK